MSKQAYADSKGRSVTLCDHHRAKAGKRRSAGWSALPCAYCDPVDWTERGWGAIALLLSLLAVLASGCRRVDGEGGPVIVVDPGPPFGPCGARPRPAVHHYPDGSVVVVIPVEACRRAD